MWPIGLFLFAVFFIDFFLFYAIGQFSAVTRMPPLFMSSMLYGMVIGQVCLLPIVAAFYGRCWLAGITSASLLGIVAFTSLMLGQSWQFYVDFYELSSAVWGAFAVPSIVLAGSAPLLLVRVIFGWRLTRETEVHPYRQAAGLEELFIVTAAIASILFLGRVPQVAWETASTRFFSAGLMMSAMLAGIGLLISLPAVHLAFRIQSHWRRRLALIGFVAAASVVLCTATYTIYFLSTGPGGASRFFEAFVIFVAAGGIAGVIMIAGLEAMLASGFQFTRAVTVTGTRRDTAGDQVNVGRRLHRRWALVLFAFAVASSFSLLKLNAWRANTEERNLAAYRDLQSQGGDLAVRDRKIVELTFGPDTTDQSLAEYSASRDVEAVSLANTKITDAGLAALHKFPKLRSLDLSNTTISDRALPDLRKLGLYHLSLAGTQVTPSTLPNLLYDFNLSSIDVGHLGLNDEFLTAMLNMRTVPRVVSLRGNAMTDAGLKAFFSKPRVSFSELDLSEMDIDGSGLAGVRLDKLILEDVPLTDATFGPLLKGLRVEMLVLSNTNLTDAIFPQLGRATGIRGLALRNGNFTEDGLVKCGPTAGFYQLHLTGRQFTGSCFKTWHPAINRLSMSGSAINDATVKHLTNLLNLSELDLSHTQISDAALPTLVKLACYRVDLSHTQITAQGLQAAFHENSFSQIRVALGQFTLEEVRELKKRVPIVVGMPHER